MGQDLHLFLLQHLRQSLHGGPQGVHLDYGQRNVVVGGQHGLQHFAAQILLQRINELLGMTVPDSQGIRHFQRSLGPYGIAENPVDQSRHFRLEPAIFLCQQHRLIDGGAVWNFIQFVDLVQPQVQDIPDHGVQVLHLAGEQLCQEKVQQCPVLLHAVAEPGGQGCIPAVQLVPGDIILQNAVGPGALLPAGNENIQCGFSSRHFFIPPKDGHGNNPLPP